MVDPTKGISGVSNVLSGQKTGATSDNKAKPKEEQSRASSEPVDEVQISQDALSLQDAEDTARVVREQLERDSAETLSKAGALQDLLA